MNTYAHDFSVKSHTIISPAPSPSRRRAGKASEAQPSEKYVSLELQSMGKLCQAERRIVQRLAKDMKKLNNIVDIKEFNSILFRYFQSNAISLETFLSKLDNHIEYDPVHDELLALPKEYLQTENCFNGQPLMLTDNSRILSDVFQMQTRDLLVVMLQHQKLFTKFLTTIQRRQDLLNDFLYNYSIMESNNLMFKDVIQRIKDQHFSEQSQCDQARMAELMQVTKSLSSKVRNASTMTEGPKEDAVLSISELPQHFRYLNVSSSSIKQAETSIDEVGEISQVSQDTISVPEPNRVVPETVTVSVGSDEPIPLFAEAAVQDEFVYITQEDYVKLQNENRSLLADLDIARNSTAFLETELRRCTQELRLWEADCRKYEERFLNALKEHERQVNELQNQHVEKEKEINARMNSMQVEHDTRVDVLRKAIDDLTRKLQLEEEKSTRLNEQLADTAANLKIALDLNKRHEDQERRLDKTLQECQSQLSTVTSQLEQLTKEKTILRDELVAIENRNHEMAEQISIKTNAILRLEEEISRLKMVCEQKNERVREVEATLCRQNEELDQLMRFSDVSLQIATPIIDKNQYTSYDKALKDFISHNNTRIRKLEEKNELLREERISIAEKLAQEKNPYEEHRDQKFLWDHDNQTDFMKSTTKIQKKARPATSHPSLQSTSADNNLHSIRAYSMSDISHKGSSWSRPTSARTTYDKFLKPSNDPHSSFKRASSANRATFSSTSIHRIPSALRVKESPG